tara:strand:- start:193 stop:459 length:267 start_codon:yes stop_codon:yes gene_type:complete
MSPEDQKELGELWDTLYHYYTLAEFYDDLEAHPWSVANMSDKLDKIIKYNGAEFQNLYDEYRGWVEHGKPLFDKPKRPLEEFVMNQER